MHEGLHDADLLTVPLRKLADRAVEDHTEALAELVAELWVSRAAQAGQRVELLARGHPGVEAQVAREVAEAPAGLDAVTPCVKPQYRGAPARRPDQIEQQPDGRTLARAVRAEVAEDLAALHAQVEVRERMDILAVRLRQAVRLDRRLGHT